MRAVAPGVWLLDGPVPNLVNAYLVEGPDGDVLVDAGTRWAAGRILRQLRGRKLAGVALTHCHPDHQGAVAEVCRRFRVPLACHELDAPFMEGKAPFVPHTLPVQLFGPLLAGPPHPVGQRLQGGESVGGFRVVPAPGHTPGHVIYFRDSDRVALVGDVVRNAVFRLQRPVVHEPPHAFSVDPLENRRSLRRLLDLDPALLLFGHGMPCADVALVERYAAQWGV